MIRASMPPTKKKIKAVAPYRMPIRLWSTVVTHDRQPVVGFGRVSTPSGWLARPVPGPAGRASGSRSTMAMDWLPSLLQGGEVGDEVVDLVFGQRQLGHPPPVEVPPGRVRIHRLEVGRVADPPLEVVAVQLTGRGVTQVEQ